MSAHRDEHRDSPLGSSLRSQRLFPTYSETCHRACGCASSSRAAGARDGNDREPALALLAPRPAADAVPIIEARLPFHIAYRSTAARTPPCPAANLIVFGGTGTEGGQKNISAGRQLRVGRPDQDVVYRCRSMASCGADGSRPSPSTRAAPIHRAVRTVRRRRYRSDRHPICAPTGLDALFDVWTGVCIVDWLRGGCRRQLFAQFFVYVSRQQSTSRSSHQIYGCVRDWFGWECHSDVSARARAAYRGCLGTGHQPCVDNGMEFPVAPRMDLRCIMTPARERR